MIMPPCKENGLDCKDRRVGCQSTCPEMAKYWAKLDAAKENEKKHKHLDAYRKETSTRLKDSSGCVPSVILKNKLRSQERRYDPYGKTGKKEKSGGRGAGG